MNKFIESNFLNNYNAIFNQLHIGSSSTQYLKQYINGCIGMMISINRLSSKHLNSY